MRVYFFRFAEEISEEHPPLWVDYPCSGVYLNQQLNDDKSRLGPFFVDSDRDKGFKRKKNKKQNRGDTGMEAGSSRTLKENSEDRSCM